MKKKTILQIVLLFLIYFVTARAGLGLNAVSGFATFVWPPTGIALAALLIFGYRLWPGILLGATLVNFFTGASLGIALALGVGNTLEALVGAFVLKRAGFNVAFERLKDVLAFIIYGAVLSTIISATIGTSSLFWGRIVSSETFGETWLAWWIGDILGALIVGSFLLCLRKIYTALRNIRSVNKSKIFEASAMLLCLIIFNSIIFFNIGNIAESNASLIYLLFPLLIWTSLRFEVAGAVCAIFITSIIATSGTVLGIGPFVSGTVSQSLLLLQIFMGSVSATILVLSVIVFEKEQSYKALKKVDRAKSEFVSIASHQLRTPLATVKWYAHSLLDTKTGRLGQKQKEYLSELNHANERMIKLVNTLLNLSKIELGIFLIKPISSVVVRNIIDEVIQELHSQIEKKKLAIEHTYTSEIFYVKADPSLIRIVFQNLLSNSIKYSTKEGKIQVILKHNQKEWILSVYDQGSGIPLKDQPEVFSKLFRAENAKNLDPEGNGLGLYIVKSITEQAGGKIWFESEVDKGSAFHVAFPLNR